MGIEPLSGDMQACPWAAFTQVNRQKRKMPLVPSPADERRVDGTDWSARADLDLVGRVTGQGPKVVRIARQNSGSTDVVAVTPIDGGC